MNGNSVTGPRMGMHHWKIRNKLIALVVLAGVVPLLLFGIWSAGNAGKVAEEEILSGNMLYATLTRERIETFFHSREGEVRILSSSRILRENLEILNAFSADREQQEGMHKEFEAFLAEAKTQYGYTDLFLTNGYGEVVYSLQYNPLDLAPLVASREEVRTALSGRQVWSDLFWNSFIKDNILVLSTPVYGWTSEGSTPVGTVNLVMNQRSLDDIVRSGIDRLGDTGNAFLIAADGLLLTNPLRNPAGRAGALKETLETERAQWGASTPQGSEGSEIRTGQYVSSLGEVVLGTLTPVRFGGSDVNLVTEVAVSEALSSLAGLRLRLVIAAAVLLLAGLLAAGLLSGGMTRPIAAMLGVIREIADYNLDVETEAFTEGRRDEIGALEQAVVTIRGNLRSVMEQVGSASHEVVHASSLLHRSTRQSAASSEQTAALVQTIAQGAADQAEAASDALTQMLVLQETLQSDDRDVAELSGVATRVVQIAQEGQAIVEELAEVNHQAREAGLAVRTGMERSEAVTAHIEQASRLIATVADQTHLISLNAAIEAARAGDAGRSFSVVADEIRMLAGQSREATQTISKVLHSLRQDHQRMQGTVSEMLDISQIQSERVQSTRLQYNNITHAIETATRRIDALQDTRGLMGDMRQRVERDLKRLADVGAKTAEMTLQVTSSVQEQSAVTAEVALSGEALAGLAEELRTLVLRFRMTKQPVSENRLEETNKTGESGSARDLEYAGIPTPQQAALGEPAQAVPSVVPVI